MILCRVMAFALTLGAWFGLVWWLLSPSTGCDVVEFVVRSLRTPRRRVIEWACWGLLVCWIFCSPSSPFFHDSTQEKTKIRKKNPKKQKIAYAQPKKIIKNHNATKNSLLAHTPFQLTLYFLCPLGLASTFFWRSAFQSALIPLLEHDNDDGGGGSPSSS